MMPSTSHLATVTPSFPTASSSCLIWEGQWWQSHGMDPMLSFACLLPDNSPWHPCSPLRDCYGLTFSFSPCRSLARLCMEDIWPWSSDRFLMMLSIAGWSAWDPGCVPGLCPSLSMSEVWGLAGADWSRGTSGWPAASWSGTRGGTAVRTQEHPQLSLGPSQRDSEQAVAAKHW